MSNIFRIGQSKAKKIKKEDVNVTYFSAPRRVEAPSRHRCDSCPSDEFLRPFGPSRATAQVR